MELKTVDEMIKKMSFNLRSYANHLDDLSNMMMEHNDIGYVSEVAGSIANLIMSLRLDLLISVPFRVYEKELKKNKELKKK